MTREAELELEIVRLREALHYSLGAWHYDGVSDEHGSIFEEANYRCDSPYSTTALQELIEKVERRTIERCALAADDAYANEYQLHAIRALPTGNLKLEDLK